MSELAGLRQIRVLLSVGVFLLGWLDSLPKRAPRDGGSLAFFVAWNKNQMNLDITRKLQSGGFSAQPIQSTARPALGSCAKPHCRVKQDDNPFRMPLS